ncbi:MAG: glycosyltransferase family 4 protein [Armatimonadetes bacterium]|nr:glycosyltransferase family 4 protein [Armatimonadota bacterium]
MTQNEIRPLRIAIFSDSALPILNGVSVSIDALVRGLREQGHSVSIFTSSYFLHKDEDPQTYRFLALETPWTKNYPLAFPPFYPMLYQFRKQNFDIIHTHTPWTVGFVGLRWAQSHGIPIVSTYHTLYDKYSHYIPFIPKRYIRYKIAKHTNFYYNSVDHVITPSEASLKWLRRHSVARPITVIPTGIPNPKWLDRADARMKLEYQPSDKVLLYVGRIAEEKNIITLLQSSAAVMRKDKNVKLMLVGDGPARFECVQATRDLGIGDRVRFTGYVPRDRVGEYYSAADLFLFSSVTETQGLVIWEAMSYGLPAIVVQGGGASTAVQNDVNGILVRNDISQFASAIEECLNDENVYTRLSAGARQQAREMSIDRMTERIVDIYHSAVTPLAPREPQWVRS